MMATARNCLRLTSSLVAGGLLIVSLFGFGDIHKRKSTTSFESLTSLGCLCLLGVCFGTLLLLAESKWGKFFIYFGFLKFRLGRTILYGVAGVMVSLNGITLGKQCNCSSYVLVILEGFACLIVAILQILAMIFLRKNNPNLKKKTSPDDDTKEIPTTIENKPPNNENTPDTPKTNKTLNQENDTNQYIEDLPDWMRP